MMKAIATQTLILLILLATFITLSIPSLIKEIKINRTTTTSILGITTPLKITTTTTEIYECENDRDCQGGYWCYPPKNCMIGIQGTSKCTQSGICVKECNSDSDCDSVKICEELHYFVGDVGASRKGCMPSNKYCEKDGDCINKCLGCFRKGYEPFNDCGAVPTGHCECINNQCQRVYSTTTTITETECNTEQDCIDSGKCDPGLECTCYQGKCYTGYVAGTTTTISGQECSDSDNGINPTEKGTTSGVNGTYTDYCTSKGNLVEYYCGGGYCYDGQCINELCPPCEPSKYTISREIDCDGLCQNGACPSFCPESNEKLKYTYIREDGIKVELEDTKKYSCLLTLDYKQDEFDCRDDIYIDMEVTAQAVDRWNLCTGEFNMQITATNIYGDKGTCTYRCEVLI